MKVDGACHCGNTRYEADVDPNTVGICHCTDCQTLTGSAYRVSARVPAASFVLSGGPPTAARNERMRFARYADPRSMRRPRKIRQPIRSASAR